MDGKRLQTYWSKEINALIESYQQFATLIPSLSYDGSAHHGEDGRYVEDLLKEYLKKYLPKGLEILTGFILRPSVKTGTKGKERKDETDQHSTQLDLIIFDSERYPIFQRFGDSCIVPPEGVIGIISVKKHFNDNDIKKECEALWKASQLCRTIYTNDRNDKTRGPYLALVSMNSKINKTDTINWIFDKINDAYQKENEQPTFDDLVGIVVSLNEWSIFKTRPSPKNKPTKAKYVYLKHKKDEAHLGLQFLLTGLFSVFYDVTRRNIRRPGFTAFPSGRNHDKSLGNIECNGIR